PVGCPRRWEGTTTNTLWNWSSGPLRTGGRVASPAVSRRHRPSKHGREMGSPRVCKTAPQLENYYKEHLAALAKPAPGEHALVTCPSRNNRSRYRSSPARGWGCVGG
ncbi:unnamed protein product, partial [Ectocarpus sp. 12 AP-2014]